MRREEVIQAIEKLDGGSVHPQEVDELQSTLKLWHQCRLTRWQESWVRKGLVIGLAFPFLFAIYMAKTSFMNPFFGIDPWIIYILFFGALFIIAWAYSVLKPGFSEEQFGLHRRCVRCGYDLLGLESVLGDELWVGPAVCPECGQKYPAVGD